MQEISYNTDIIQHTFRQKVGILNLLQRCLKRTFGKCKKQKKVSAVLLFLEARVDVFFVQLGGFELIQNTVGDSQLWPLSKKCKSTCLTSATFRCRQMARISSCNITSQLEKKKKKVFLQSVGRQTKQADVGSRSFSTCRVCFNSLFLFVVVWISSTPQHFLHSETLQSSQQSLLLVSGVFFFVHSD